MTFPNIQVQPHWLATLERAKEALPNCRFVCTAINADVEPRIEEEIREAIREAIHPWNFVCSWHFHETGQPLERDNEYRITWLNHMIEQCRT